MFTTTPDQELFARTTNQFLEATYPIKRVRELADEDDTFEADRWREGAALGWTSLLVPEELGGGSVSGNGVADLLVVCSLFGHHAAPGPLLGTNLVAAALARWGTAEQQAGPLADLVSGNATAAWAHTSTLAAPGGRLTRVTATRSPDGVVLSGRIAHVECATAAEHLLVTADAPDGRTQFLVPLASPGVELSALRGVDLTRRYHDVDLDGVVVPSSATVGEAGAADDHDDELVDLLAVMLAGEMVGATARAFAMTVDWTVDRYSFGRPLGAYQAIKHRMAEARTQLEASEAIAGQAAVGVGLAAPDAWELASAAMTFVAERTPEIVQECIQFHGGIGVTYELDLHLFLRRVVIDSQLFGSTSDFARRLGALVVSNQGIAS